MRWILLLLVLTVPAATLASDVRIVTSEDYPSNAKRDFGVVLRGCRGTQRLHFQPVAGAVHAFSYDTRRFGVLRHVTIMTTTEGPWPFKRVEVDQTLIMNGTPTDPSPPTVTSSRTVTRQIAKETDCSWIPLCLVVGRPDQAPARFVHAFRQLRQRPLYRGVASDDWLYFGGAEWQIGVPAAMVQADGHAAKRARADERTLSTAAASTLPHTGFASASACSDRSIIIVHGGGTMQPAIMDHLAKLARRNGYGRVLHYVSTASREPRIPSGDSSWGRRFDTIVPHFDRRPGFDYQRFVESFFDGMGNLRVGAIYLSGGRQSRLRDAYVGDGDVEAGEISSTQRFLVDLNRMGVPILGSSAGAAALSDPTNSGNGQIRGLGLLPGVIIDQHFETRGRESRLRSAVAKPTLADLIGLGVDENSAVLISGGHRAQVLGDERDHQTRDYGKGVTVIYDGGRQTARFPPGATFDLRTFSPLIRALSAQ